MKKPTFDILRARHDTPGCRNVIHFNNAGASLIPQPVLDTVIDYLKLEASIGGYEAASQSLDKIEKVYDGAAALIGCNRDEIAFVENATRAWDMAFYAIPFQTGDKILTSVSEYASNFIPFLQLKKKIGIEIEIIPNDEYGQVSISALQNMIESRVKLIAVTHVPTNGGLVNPAAGIGRIARESDVLFLLDACQSVGQIPIDVNEIGCDMLSGTGRKYLRGPRGTGFLYVRSPIIEKLEPPFLDLHAATWISSNEYVIRGDVRRFENWETNCCGKIGLGAAFDYVLKWGIGNIWKRITFLASKLREELLKIPYVQILDLGVVKCGIVSFLIEGIDPHLIWEKLFKKKINVSIAQRAHTRIDMETRNLDRFIRASVHYYNTEEEIDRFCEVLESVT